METLAQGVLLATQSHGSVATEWDSIGSIIFQLAVIAFFVFLNGFFVAAEFALVKVRDSELDKEIGKGKGSAKLGKRMRGDLDSYLAAGQLGITIASLALGFLGAGFVGQWIEPAFAHFGIALSEGWVRGISIGIAFTLVTFLHITLGEQIPKAFAVRHAVGTTMSISRPLHWFSKLFQPVLWLFNAISKRILKWVFRIDPVYEHGLVHTSQELARLVRESGASSEVTETERDILINALELNELVVRDIMTPRSDVVCLDVEHSFEDNWSLAMETEHTRFPLVQGHMDSTLGLVHIKDLMKLVNAESPTLLDVKREILEVPEMMALDELLVFFLKKHAHLALAVDEFGGTLGMVTFDNVIEELVGEIQDEFDDEDPEFEEIGEGNYQIEGKLGLHELEPITGLEIDSPDVSTVGGYVTHLLGHLPEQGEKVRIEDYEVTVTKADGRRVIEVRFLKMENEEDFSPGLRQAAEAEAEAESKSGAA